MTNDLLMTASTRISTKHTWLPYLALAAGILTLSLSAIFVRWAAAPPTVMGAYRIGISTLFLGVFVLRQPGGLPRLTWAQLVFPVVGGLMAAFDHALWNTSIGMTKAANATLLNNTAPLWVALVAWLFLREKLRAAFWVGLALTMGGAAVVLSSDFLLHPRLGVGDLFALASGVFYGGYFLVTQRGRAGLGSLTYIWIVGLVASLTLFGLSALLGEPLHGFSRQTYLAFIGAGVISQSIGYLSVGYALGHLRASIVAPTMIIQPVVTALIAIPLLGENLSAAQWLGGCGVLAGIFLVHKSRENINHETGKEFLIPAE